MKNLFYYNLYLIDQFDQGMVLKPAIKFQKVARGGDPDSPVTKHIPRDNH